MSPIKHEDGTFLNKRGVIAMQTGEVFCFGSWHAHILYCSYIVIPPPPCLNGRAHGLEFWHGGQVEGYVGQGHRSKVNVKVKVKRSKNVHCLRTLSMDLPKKKLLNTTGRNPPGPTGEKVRKIS